MCGGISGSFNFYVSFCEKTGNELIIRAPNRELNLYYVGAIYQQASCAADSICQSVESFSYQDVPLSVVMASPPTMTTSSVGYTNTCCPVAWYLDSTNEVTGTWIKANQEMILAATAVNFHYAQTKTLKFKLVYFDGTITKWSALLSRTVTITCLQAVIYQIDNVEQISVFTTSPGVITTKNYATCLGGGIVTVTCDQTVRPGYAVVSGNQITMDFTKRVSTQFIDENYFVRCTHTSTTGQYYTDEYRVDSIDCVKGFQTPPNPALTLESQTVALETSQKKFTILHNTPKTITVSAFSISQVPILYGKQCELSYNIQAPDGSGITITKPSATNFNLNTTGYTPKTLSDTVTMKLTVSSPQFKSPFEYSFNLEMITVCTATNLKTSITSYNIYYLISGEEQTVKLPYVLSGSQCSPLDFAYYDANGTQQSIPSWLTFSGTGGTGDEPTVKIQLSDKTKKGRHRIDMLVLSQAPISFYLYLAALVQPTVMYNPLTLNAANQTWLTDQESTNFSLVYKWSVDDTKTNVSTRFQIESHTMSINGTAITQTKTSSTTTNGLTWTPDSNGNYELGWKILADKTQPDGLQMGPSNMQLTVSVAFTDIDGGDSKNIIQTVSEFQLSLKSCSDASHFSAPATPGQLLYDLNMNALNANSIHTVNVKNPKNFYFGAFTINPCDFVAKCCPLTYSGQAYRSDNVLISSQNGGVEILMINQQRKIYDNQLNASRLPLPSENFIQQITFKVTVSNGFAFTTFRTLKFKLVNCEQNPPLPQPNFIFAGVSYKNVYLEWQNPSSALDASCIPYVYIYAIDDTTLHRSYSFDNYQSSLGCWYWAFIEIQENTLPPQILLRPLSYTCQIAQFARTWKMKIQTRNGDNTPVNGQEWSDEKIFYIDMCHRSVLSDAVISGQNLILKNTGIKYIYLKKSTTPSGSSVCQNLYITYVLLNHPTWISLTVDTDPDKNTLSIDPTGLSVPQSKTFQYKMSYYVNQGDTSPISDSTYSISITVDKCSQSDFVLYSSSRWFKSVPDDNFVYNGSKNIYKSESITLKAFITNNREEDCGVTLYDQYIKVQGGTTVNQILTECTSFTFCYGYMLDATQKEIITINLSNMPYLAVSLTVTIVTTFYNASLPVAQGLKKEFQLYVKDCSQNIPIQPDPWMVSGTFQIGSQGTEIKQRAYNSDQHMEVMSFSTQSDCTVFSLLTDNATYQSIFYQQSAQVFYYQPNDVGTINNKLQIACSLKIEILGVSIQLIPFTITLYNCSSPVETSKTYVYAAMLGSANPLDYEVTFPWSDSAISYLEFCNKFSYLFGNNVYGPVTYVTTPPTWVTLMNYNPITHVNGVHLKIKTSNQQHAGFWFIRKSLLVTGVQEVWHYVNICIYQPPTPMFTNADSTLTLKVLDFLPENCTSFNIWNVIKRPPSCSNCVDANCDNASTVQSNYNFKINEQLLTTDYSGGLKFANDPYSNKRKLCWKLPEVSGNDFTMSYVISVTPQSFQTDFTFKKISCSDFTVVDPSPWMKQQPANLALPGSGSTVYFPPAVQITFVVQPYSNNNFCDSTNTCCSTSIVSSTVKTFSSTNLSTEITGFMTSNASVLTLLDTQVPGWLESALEKTLTVEVQLNAAFFSFERTFDVKFVNCSVASQPNINYLINRGKMQSYTLNQAQNSCAALIRIKQPDGTPFTRSWFSSTESSATQIKINNSEVTIDDSQLGNYDLQRYVETITSPVQKYNILDFKLSLCKLTPPGNNGVDPGYITSFDIANPTGTLKFAYGSVSSGIACSNILYSVSGLQSWMTYDSESNQLVMTMPQSVQERNIVYTLTYNDGVSPNYTVPFTINLRFVICAFTVPINWVSPKLNPTAFALIFDQDSELEVVYAIKSVTMQSTELVCGTPTYSASATMTTNENTTTFVSMTGLEVTVNLGARVSDLPIFTMNVTVQIDIPRQSTTKEFTINFFDCRIPKGTISPLPNQQFEVEETKSYTVQGYQELDIRCTPFKILIAFETPTDNWTQVTIAGTPLRFISYTSTAGQAPTLSFQVKHEISDKGTPLQYKLVLTNRTNVTKIESSIFTFTVCKAQVNQAFISPSSTALKDNVFDLVRSLTAAQPKLQVQLSSAYYDLTQPLCTYTSLTIVNLDTSQVPMTVQTIGLTETLEMDSFAWTSNGLVYSRELEVKLWHNTELVYFATAPHKFTVKIYDCEKDMVPPSKWIVQNPQFSSFTDYLFQTGSGDYSLNITVPLRNYSTAICGALVFEISCTNQLAITNLVLDSSTGLITVKTPANVHWGPEVVDIKVKNSYAAITPNSFTFRVHVYDCMYAAIINANKGSQPAVTEMVTTGPDWSYTWNAFTTSFSPCVVDKYEVACSEGAYNFGSNPSLCSRGFQYNTSPTATQTAALDSKTINPLTIYAQYHETEQISVDHEGEFTFTISAYNALSPMNKDSYSILVKIKTPCDNPLNQITATTQAFVGNCPTSNQKPFCDDVHYYIFTSQSNPIAPFTARFAYSCTLTYQIKLKEAGVEVDVPSFISLVDSNGAATTTAPLQLKINSVLNSDKDYSYKTLVLRASVQQFSEVTEFKLFVYNDCSKERVAMLNLQQTFNASFQVGQDMMAGTSPTYLTFRKVSAVQTQDQKYCLVDNSGLTLRQLNMPSSIVTSYNPNLFQFTADQANDNNRLHIKASKDADVISSSCDLGNFSTRSCMIDLQIEATGLNGTYPLVATGQVEFKTECNLSLQYWDQMNPAPTDYWVWDQSDKTAFKQFYQIHSPLVTLKLPRITELILPSFTTSPGKKFAEVCGTTSYNLTTPFEPLTFLEPASAIDWPKIQVISKNPLHANKHDPLNFAKAYPLDLQAFNSKGAFSVTYATTPARQDALTFRIQDLCYGVTYSKPKIYFNDGRNLPKDTENLLVVQPVLFPRYDVKMYHQTFTINSGDPSKCGQLAYSGKQSGDIVIKMGSIKDKQMNQIDGLYFNLYADENQYRGFYNVIFTAFLNDTDNAYAYHYPASDAIIQVHIEECFVRSYSPSQSAPPNLVFKIFGQAQTFLFNDFLQVPACNYTQQFNLTAYKVEDGNVPEFKEGSLPQKNPFKLDNKDRKITFETKLISLVNTNYQFYITGHLDNSQNLQELQVNHWGPFFAEIVDSAFMLENTAPVIKEIKSEYIVYKGETGTVKIGQVYDQEGDKVSLVSWQVTDFASKWFNLSSGINLDNLSDIDFDVNIPADPSDLQFNLYLSLVDNHKRKPITVDFIIKFKVNDRTSETQFDGVTQTKKTQQDQFQYDLAPAGMPQQISPTGGFIFQFDSPIDIDRLGNYASWNSTNVGKTYFEFILVPGDQAFFRDNEDSYRYTWNITNTTSTTITFQFAFSDYDVISSQAKDKMRFKILVPELFVNEKTKKPTTFTTSLQSLPRQVKDAQAQQSVQTVTESIDGFIKIVSASSFLNVILSSSLQFLWGMINALQIIVYTVLFNLKTPVNALEIEILFLQMVKFDPFQTDTILQKLFKFDLEKQPTLSSRFEKAKYESSNFVLNMGTMFLIQIIYIFMAGLLPLLRWFCQRKSFCIERRLKRIKIFNGFSRFYLESLLEISINVLMTFKLMKFDVWKQKQIVFSNIWAVGNSLLLVIMPCILFYVAMQYQKKYNTDWDYREQYDDIFSELKGRSKLSMLYFTFFTFRRYLFAITLIVIPKKYLAQTFIQILASSFFLIFILHVKPFKDPKQGKMELFNEFTVSVSLYFLFIFTDFCPDSTRRYQVGWAKVSLIVLNLAVNVVIMMVQTFLEYKTKIKIWCVRRRIIRRQLAILEAQISGLDSQINQPSPLTIIQQVEEPVQIRELQIRDPTVQEILDYDIQHHLHAVMGRAPQESAPVEQRIIDNFYSQFEEYNAPDPERPQTNENDSSVQSMLDYRLKQLHEAQLRPQQKQAPVEQRIIDNFYSQFEEQNPTRSKRPKEPTTQEPQADQKEESVQETHAVRQHLKTVPRDEPSQKQVDDHQKLVDDFYKQYEEEMASRQKKPKALTPQESQADQKEESVQDMLDYAIKHHLQAVPSRKIPEKQVHEHQRLVDNFYSQFEEQKAPREKRPKARTPQEPKADYKEESVQDMLDYDIKHHLKAVPRHKLPQKQVQDHQRLLDNFYSQFEEKNYPQRISLKSQRKQANTRRNTMLQSTNQSDDANEDLSGCQLVLNRSDRRPSNRSQTPADVIQEYNHKRELEKELFGKPLNKRRF